jgi:hypothetical protein
MKAKLLKRIYIISILTLTTIQAQIVINVNQPPANQLKLEHLWSIDITNLTGQPKNIYLKGIVTESKDGVIFEVTSNPSQIHLGTRRLTYTDLSPIKIHYSNKKYEDALINTGGVPEGEYDYVVVAFSATDNKELARGNIPMKHIVYNPLPPQLLSPINGIEIDNDLPLFSWLPPLNLPLNKQVNYEVTIVELYARQSITDAISSNPVFFKWNGKNNTFQYPVSARKLFTGMSYAWQVKVFGASGELIGISEPSFFVKKISYDDNFGLGSIKRFLPYQIHLVAPINGQIIEEDAPVFGSVILQNDANIDIPSPSGRDEEEDQIIIVEIIGQQTPQEAIKINPVWYSFTIKDLITNYPEDGKKFEDGKKYAWQIIIYNRDGSIKMKSDIGSFEFRLKKNSLIIKDSSYTYSPIVHRFETNYLTASNSKIPTLNFAHNRNFLIGPNQHDFFNPEKNDSPINFSGSSTFSYQFADRQAVNSEIPKSQWQLNLNSTLSIFNLPIGFNAFLSSDQKDNRQNINNFQFSFNPYEIAVNTTRGILGSFFSIFSVLGIGTNIPNYSSLTLSGTPVSGIDLEITPGPFLLAFTYGRTQKAIEGSYNLLPTYRRDLIATKLGLGKQNDTHFHLTVIHSKDDETSIKTSSSSVNPQENIVAAVESRIVLFENVFMIQGEIVGSFLTSDVRSANLTTEKIPDWLQKIIKPKVSSSVDYAYTISSILNLPSQTRLSGYYKMIGPGFVTHGRQFLRNDLIEYELKANQSIINRTINIGVFYRNNYDNIIPWKRFRTTVRSIGANLSIYPRDLPYLTLTYSPYYQKNDSKNISEKFENENHNFTLSTGYNTIIGDLTLSSNFTFSFQESKTKSVYSNYKSQNYYLNEILMLKIPLSVSVSFGYSKNEYYLTKSEILNLGISGNYSFESGWRNSAGLTFVRNKNIEKSYGFFIDSEYPVTEFLSASLRIEKKYFYDEMITSRDFDELVGYANIRLIW